MSAASVRGGKADKDSRTYYEVRRKRVSGRRGKLREPYIERHNGLDRARLAALAYALDGPTATGEQFTGTVEIHRIMTLGDRPVRSEVIDVIDERVAFRVLNEIALPRASQMSVSADRLQEEANRLALLGFE